MEIDFKARAAAWEENDRLSAEESARMLSVVLEAEIAVMRYPEDARLRDLSNAVRRYLEIRNQRSAFISDTLMPMYAAKDAARQEASNVG